MLQEKRLNWAWLEQRRGRDSRRAKQRTERAPSERRAQHHAFNVRRVLRAEGQRNRSGEGLRKKYGVLARQGLRRRVHVVIERAF